MVSIFPKTFLLSLTGDGDAFGMALTALSTAFLGKPISIRERTVGEGGGGCVAPAPPLFLVRLFRLRRFRCLKSLEDTALAVEG